MRIVLDAMGSDTCPEPEVLAAVEVGAFIRRTNYSRWSC